MHNGFVVLRKGIELWQLLSANSLRQLPCLDQSEYIYMRENEMIFKAQRKSYEEQTI